MKTKEEIMNAVLAELERVCPQAKDERVYYGEKHYILPIEDEWWRMRVGGVRLDIGPPIEEEDASDPSDSFLAAYRLLGLEARDAVAAKDAEIAELKAELEAERERAKGLVMALENIREFGDMQASFEASAALEHYKGDGDIQ